MFTKKIMAGLLLIVTSAFATVSFAVPTNGGISFAAEPGTIITFGSGSIDYNPDVDNVNVTDTTGDFSFIADGTLGTFFDLTYNPFSSPTSIWSVAGLTWNASSLDIVLETNDLLVLSGNGSVTDGTDTSEGTWNLTLNSAGGTVSFSSSAEVPEASSIAMLGLGLVGLGFAARRRQAR